jgi:hypothetical protein
MNCSVCQKTKQIPTHVTDLIIGKVSIEDDVLIYVENVATGYIYRQEAIVNPDGSVILDMTLPHPSFYNPHGQYNISVTDIDEHPTSITIGEVEYDCLSVTFKNVFNDSGYVDFLEWEVSID